MYTYFANIKHIYVVTIFSTWTNFIETHLSAKKAVPNIGMTYLVHWVHWNIYECVAIDGAKRYTGKSLNRLATNLKS